MSPEVGFMTSLARRVERHGSLRVLSLGKKSIALRRSH